MISHQLTPLALFLPATKQLYEHLFPSVCLSVCHTFLTMFLLSYHPELLPLTDTMSMQKSRSEVKGQCHRGHDPHLAVSGTPVGNMAMK